jgi:hypothetical protein
VSFHVGGGITWSSDARAEDEETLVKGAALARALEAEPVGSSTSRNAGEEKAAQKVRRPPPEEDPW